MEAPIERPHHRQLRGDRLGAFLEPVDLEALVVEAVDGVLVTPAERLVDERLVVPATGAMDLVSEPGQDVVADADNGADGRRS